MNQIVRKVARIREVFETQGLSQVFRQTWKVISMRIIARTPLIQYVYFKLFKASNRFSFQNREYKYFCHRYNWTWRNERAVEIPICMAMIDEYAGKKILEVGNVLSHYFDFKHDIVDKFEKADNVINHDIVTYKSSKKYNLIVTISTLEHVGWEETPRKSEEVLAAIDSLVNLLDHNGKLVVTIPLGYNSDLDGYLRDKKISFDEQYYLKSHTRDNQWLETGWGEVEGIEYDFEVFRAKGLMIGIIHNNN